MDKSLGWLVVSNIDRLGETSAAWRSDDNLNAKVDDCEIDQTHLVNTLAVQKEEMDNAKWCCHDIWL